MSNVIFNFNTLGEYTVPPGNNITFDFDNPDNNIYQPPFGGNVIFNFNTLGEYTVPPGNNITFDFNPSPITGQITAIPDLITCFRTPWEKAELVQSNINILWGITRRVNVATRITWYDWASNIIVTDFLLKQQQSNFKDVDVDYKLDSRCGALADRHCVIYTERYGKLEFQIDKDWMVKWDDSLEPVTRNIRDIWGTLLPLDLNTEFRWFAIKLDQVDPHIFPIQSNYLHRQVHKFDEINYTRDIPWGYGVNHFLVGGTTDLPARNETDVEPPPGEEPITHINYEVFRTVNIVNITTVPDGTVIKFDNFTLQRDLESFVWTATFDVLDITSFNLIRPIGKTLKEVDININGTIFRVFVSKTASQIREGGKRIYSCTGWSDLKRLSAPYSNKKSFRSTTNQLANQLVNTELSGSGYTYTWSTTDWQVPAGVHSYQDKTPLGAILDVVSSVGAVIVPHTQNKSFEVKPYYPIVPWLWSNPGTTPDRVMNEMQFFTIDSETIPKDNPDAVHVFGEETGGVGILALRSGKAAIKVLPDVVNKYMTDNNAAQTRGSQEVARNSFIEEVTMSTYVDDNGIIMPQELVEFTALVGPTWRGMILSTSITCDRVGTALTQTITVAKFYDN